MLTTGKHTHTRPARAGSYDMDDDAGFSLIEAIVSLTIFAIVTAAAVSAIVVGIKTSNTNRDRTTAASVAQQALVEAQAAPASSLTAAPSTMTAPIGQESYTVKRVVTVETAAGTASPVPVPTASSGPPSCPASIVTGTAYLLHVTVTVTWPGGPSSGIAMDTVRSC